MVKTFDLTVLDELKNTVSGEIYTSEDQLQKHSSNLFYIDNYFPDAVYYPENEQDILKIINICIKHKIPLIPFGSGTSVEGHTSAINGGICLNISKMRRIVEFNPIDGYVTVQAGIPYNELNDFLHPYGFYFPVEAGWGASIGGMVATNASGAGAADAGSMTKNVIQCCVIVYEDGKAIKINTGTKALKSSAGYNITNLFIGSEGTLGVITEVCIKIKKEKAFHTTICCQFDEIKSAIDFVIHLKEKVQFRKIELLDKLQTEACIIYSKINFLDKKKHTLIMELAGNKAAVDEEQGLIINYVNQGSVYNMKIFHSLESSKEIWMMRKYACPAAIQMLGKNKKVMATDASVPLSKLSDCIQKCYTHMKELNLIAPLVAHVGDGNFHFSLIVDPNDQKELNKALQFNNIVVEQALRLEGTCTGEHGIGLGKKKFLKIEHKSTLFLMKKIKVLFDPLNIFNPNKIIDDFL